MQKAVFIREISGLRVIAATIVLLAHFTGNIGLSGVGLFFVVTGYLTGSKIKRAVANGETLSFGKELRKSVWRILFPMIIVLLAIYIWVSTSVDILNRAQWLESLTPMALGFGNFFELANATSYWDRTTISSPSLHLWAMSVLIQFALILAIVRFLASRYLPKLSAQTRRNSLFGLGAFAVLLTILDSMNFDWSTSYHFSTLNWTWAFTLGLFLGGINWKLSDSPNLRWLADILFFAVIVLALLPLFGINPLGSWVRAGAAVLATICLTSPETAITYFQKFLNSKPMQFLGNITYEIYLLHWPLLIAFRYYTDENRDRKIPKFLIESDARSESFFNLTSGIVLAILSIALAWLLHQLVIFIEKKVDSIREPGLLIVQAIAVGVIPVLIFTTQGANVRPSEDVYKDLVPELATANRDTPSYFNLDCKTGIVRICSHGNENSDTRIVIIGTSTAGQWFDAAAPLADKYGWYLQTMIKEGCTHPQDRMVQFCANWREEVINLITAQKPDLIVMETSHSNKALTREQVAESDQELLEPFVSAGIKVLGIRSTPRFDFFVPECIAANPDFQNVCAINANSYYLSEQKYLQDVDESQFVGMVDLTDVFCPKGKCSPVDGNVIRYVDDKHFTRTYSATLADELEPYLLRALG